jgi:hypothetical protein
MGKTLVVRDDKKDIRRPSLITFSMTGREYETYEGTAQVVPARQSNTLFKKIAHASTGFLFLKVKL